MQRGIEYAVAEQVAVYPSDVEAIQAMEEMRQALVDCSDERTTHPADVTYTDSFWDFADAVAETSAGNLEPDESFQAWNWNRTYTEDGQPTYGLGAVSSQSPGSGTRSCSPCPTGRLTGAGRGRPRR